MKRLQSFPLRFWASLSALLLAGLSFAPSLASAETIVLPDPFYTNQFTSVEAWVQLQGASAWVMWEDEDLDDFYSYVNEILLSANSLYSYIRSLTLEVYEYSTLVSALQADLENNLPTDSDIWDNDEFLELWESIFDFYETKSRTLQRDSYQYLSYASNSVDTVVSITTQLRDRVQYTNVVTSVEFGQEYGRTLPGGGCECPDYTTYLLYLEGVLDDINDTLQVWDVRFAAFREGLLTSFSSDRDLGRAVADVLYKIHYGYFYPTNTLSRPLWVAFTNDVHIAGVVEISGNVGVTNFAELVHMLTNSVLKVKDGETEQERHDKMSADLSFMSGILDDDLEEPDQQTEQFEQIRVSGLDSVGSSVSSVIDSYQNMFDSIPSEFPADIVVHPGFTIGPLEVPSMHWNPYSSERSGLNYLRQFMRSLWYVGFVVLIWYACAIDLLLVGSVICVCYGVAFAKPQESLKGIRFFFGLFASMLGFSPPSSS